MLTAFAPNGREEAVLLREDDRKMVRQSVLLSSLRDDLVDDILTTAAARTYGRGQSMFLQGDPARFIFIVLDGWVKLYRTTPAGDEAVVGVFTRGQSFGEAVALQTADYPVTAEAVTDCRLLRLSGEAMLARMRERPELFAAMLGACFTHLHALVAQVEQLKAHTGPQRVAEFLADLAGQDGGPAAVRLPYDKVLIAGRLGMQPESLSRAFARLRKEGVHVRQNQAVIEDVQRLRRYAEGGRGGDWRASG